MPADVVVILTLALAIPVWVTWVWVSLRPGRRPRGMLPQPYQSMRERNGLPDWPPPPKVAPPPSYRDPAPRTVEDRLDALERAEAARALREVGEPSGIAGDDDISAEVRIAIAQQRYRRGLRDEVDEFERAAAGKQPKETR